MQVLTKLKIQLLAGKGGDGIVSFGHFILGGKPNKPNGPDGGPGGSIYLVGDESINTLFHLRNIRNVRAMDGTDGSIKSKEGTKGKVGDDIILAVPLFTKVYDENHNLLFNINSKEKILIARGGKKGLGNMHFGDKNNPHPIERTLGESGESKTIFLEVNSLADVGLVGLPNAGKSSFISLVTNNKAKIGNYEFTTLEPNIGILEYYSKECVIADLPGIIAGASTNKGLGIETLENIKKCKFLLLFVSMDLLDNDDPYVSYTKIKKELMAYDIDTKYIIVGTKIDNAFKETIDDFQKHFQEQVYFISTMDNKQGINQLIKSIFNTLYK
ncbi:MAG: Obg family GTPase CgtA [Mycoplasmataceae bacterium]|jgi:GTP-binding protein|nr:Obg family GTPase CgtA [Mycoplasmataceae bacterium]